MSRHFDGVRVFSATKQQDRERLGEHITDWLSKRRDAIEVVDKDVTQSSDASFHCLSIVIYFRYI